jgi:broad specificity phosphatase PhoE
VPHPLPRLFLARHGETPWSLSGQHTGRTDLALTANGERDGIKLGQRLKQFQFAAVWTSPRQRAKRTAELAGYGDRLVIDPDLAEWDYGDYEGERTEDILKRAPGWFLFRDGCPNGESPHQVGIRADRVIANARAQTGDVLVFSHGHFIRVLAARWLGRPAHDACYFVCGTASLGIMSYEHHNLQEPVVCLWNDDRHLKEST